MHIFTGMTRDNLKINVRESAEMDQADLELRATIMKVSSRSFSHSHHDHLIILTSPPWSSYHSHIATMIILRFSHHHHDHLMILTSQTWLSYHFHIATMTILSFSQSNHGHWPYFHSHIATMIILTGLACDSSRKDWPAGSNRRHYWSRFLHHFNIMIMTMIIRSS